MMHNFLYAGFLGTPNWLWLIFASVVIIALAFDLGILHRHHREIGVRESLLLSGAYVLVSTAFGLIIYCTLGSDNASDYFTGYVIEKSLSIDNIFVMALIFSSMNIPRIYQHRVLFWGVLGVIILRGLMIVIGRELIENFSWVLYIFAAFLVFTGVKLLFSGHGNSPDPVQDNRVIAWLRKRFNVTTTGHGEKFFVRLPLKGGRSALLLTPLFLALITIELTDVVFALDSVPAIFAVTTDPYIVFTSNIFAILGLRALYFALAAMIERFAYLKYALALVLIFIGGKVFMPLIGIEKIPSAVSLIITLIILAGGILFSLKKTRPKYS